MVRLYKPEDEQAVLQLLRSNIPKFFDESELADLTAYLKNERESYFVFESSEGQILGAGGMNFFDEGKTGRISWDFVHADHHGKGIGGKLLNYRLDLFEADDKIEKIVVRTSQFAADYYSKFGFKLIRQIENYWSEGYHLYYMEMNRQI